jgi:hypothetical protein
MMTHQVTTGHVLVPPAVILSSNTWYKQYQNTTYLDLVKICPDLVIAASDDDHEQVFILLSQLQQETQSSSNSDL